MSAEWNDAAVRDQHARPAPHLSTPAEGALGTPLVVVAGPTGSGKSALAMRLAVEFGGEIISCDSVAVYREFEIGCANAAVRRRCGASCGGSTPPQPSASIRTTSPS